MPSENKRPVAAFTYSCAGQTNAHQCAFDASGSTDDTGIVSYRWEWGNGRSETQARPDRAQYVGGSRHVQGHAARDGREWTDCGDEAAGHRVRELREW